MNVENDDWRKLLHFQQDIRALEKKRDRFLYVYAKRGGFPERDVTVDFKTTIKAHYLGAINGDIFFWDPFSKHFLVGVVMGRRKTKIILNNRAVHCVRRIDPKHLKWQKLAAAMLCSQAPRRQP